MTRTALIVVATSLFALPLFGAIEEGRLQQVRDDARAIQRVAEVAGRRDLPRGVLKRIVREDIEILRGRQSDGSYEYAHFEREETDRKTNDFTFRSAADVDDFSRASITGEYVFRLIVDVPSRRMVFFRNNRIFVDRYNVEYVEMDGARRTESVEVGEWIEPGKDRRFELPEVARDARVEVVLLSDPAKEGKSTVELSLVEAKLVDDDDSPYLSAVRNALLLERAIDEENVESIRNKAESILLSLGGDVSSQRPVDDQSEEPLERGTAAESEDGEPERLEPMPSIEIYLELQGIEDLLTGTPAERRDGMNRLHQLIRRLRPSEFMTP